MKNNSLMSFEEIQKQIEKAYKPLFETQEIIKKRIEEICEPFVKAQERIQKSFKREQEIIAKMLKPLNEKQPLIDTDAIKEKAKLLMEFNKSVKKQFDALQQDTKNVKISIPQIRIPKEIIKGLSKHTRE